jgi:hypothetical protein
MISKEKAFKLVSIYCYISGIPFPEMLALSAASENGLKVF